ncbi:uncharacterized protein [Amphiura filiformis]|uniref:uncharacterized protein n=1 Tax=Amphiura filiformis TaxID=82378 RepID=UPI003B2237CA
MFSENRDPLESYGNRERDVQYDLDKSLVLACNEGNIDSVIDLLQKGADVNAESYVKRELASGENYETPLQAAAKHGYVKITKMLIENGADVQGGDRYNVTPLHSAALNGHRECVRLLINAGAKVDEGTLDYNRPGAFRKPHRGGSTPLHMAAKQNHADCIEELIVNGKANYNQPDVMGTTCMATACLCGHEESALMLLKLSKGTELFGIGAIGSGDTVLHESVRHGLLECTKELLLRGINVNYSNIAGFTPLHYAVVQSSKFSYDMVELLVTLGRNIDVNAQIGGRGCEASGWNARGGTGLRPLHLVAFNPPELLGQETFHTAEFRLARNFVTSDPRNPIRHAKCAVLLIQYGADFDISYKGQSLLQQEIYTQQDLSVLNAIIRSSMTLQVPSKPAGITNYEAESEMVLQKLAWLRALFTSPRSLQHCCRYTIRSHLTAQKLNRTRELPLPPSLQDYLLLKT